MKDLQEAALWRAVLDRDASYDGVFYYGVTTTGIYCRPQCRCRKPRRENAVLSFSRQALEQAGYRPCRRCRPDRQGPGDEADVVVRLCHFIEDADGIPSLAELADIASMSESALLRLFKRAVGITPRAYADSHRIDRLRTALRRGGGVLDAAYDSGYGSASRVYENANGRLGMTPKKYQKRGQGLRINYEVVPTAMGHLLVAATNEGVCAVKLGSDPDALIREMQHEFSAAQLYRSLGPVSGWPTIWRASYPGRSFLTTFGPRPSSGKSGTIFDVSLRGPRSSTARWRLNLASRLRHERLPEPARPIPWLWLFHVTGWLAKMGALQDSDGDWNAKKRSSGWSRRPIRTDVVRSALSEGHTFGYYQE